MIPRVGCPWVGEASGSAMVGILVDDGPGRMCVSLRS